MFALLDCNNFYASCERVFNPKLNGKPIVVLSNNDGCVIARSQEAKDIGIPMGAPAFKSQHMFELNHVNVFSANFTLYGDLSSRVMNILLEYSPEIEVYSIDEAFISLDIKNIKDLTLYGKEIRSRILKGTGIPVSIGIAPTKTLAKICNHIGKKNKDCGGVFQWDLVKDKDTLLQNTSIEDIWGVGWRSSINFNEEGIYNALQFKNANESWLRKKFSVTALRIATELKGISCLPLETVHEPRKGIMSSRAFGKPIKSIKELEEAVATYTSRACEKLRAQSSAASSIYISIKTNKHKEDQPQYFNYRIVSLNNSTWYTPDLIKAAIHGLKQIYKKGYEYKKATVMLLGIVPQNQIQLNMFNPMYPFKKVEKIMHAVDIINKSHGSEFIKYAATGMRQEWRMKQEKRSDRFTTNWDELLTIKI